MAVTKHGPAWITVTGATLPSSRNTCVMPTLRPRMWSICSSQWLQLHLDFDARRHLQLGERFEGARIGIKHVDQSLVRADLELLARILVDERRPDHGKPLDFGRQRHRPRYLD